MKNKTLMVRIMAMLMIMSVALATLRVHGQATAPALTSPRVSLASADVPASIAGTYGPIHYGHEFGIPMTMENFTIFDSTSVALQTGLSGQADIVAAAFSAVLVLRDSGQDFRIFCLRTGNSDNLVIGRNGITKVEQILDPQTRIALDAPGSVAFTVLNGILQKHGIKGTTNDKPDSKLLVGAAARAAAITNNEVDVTVINITRYRELLKTVPDAVIIAEVYKELPLYISSTFAASGKWLDEHPDEAAAFCASVIKAQRVLSEDYDLYLEAVKEIMAKPPSDDSIRESWELLRTNDSWRLATGLDPEAAVFMGDVLFNTGVLKAKVDAEKAVDLRAYQAAIKLLGSYEAPDATAEAKGSKP
jgi:ABC-type nitrate/sulfonate/bicarbonate transport system substrate-binding protein